MLIDILTALAILIGLVGALTQIYPGPLVVLGAVALWAILTGGAAAWTVLAISAAAIILTGAGKYVLVGRRLSSAGVPGISLIVGGLAGIAGFFLIPVVGLPVGFTLGVYLWEWLRRGQEAPARAAAWAAIKAQGLAIVLELAGCLIAAVAWGVGLLAG
ncbi:DUF456 domain-containing protein [Actinomyces bowdenii]|uniref:DUF456 domain-containing protein n=1 Tax=Actinomyces bowdenii TaxID=131109 RepID=A0A3P1VB54_9ACTO|nr:DUF456 domain-containing protein [Actinomyces bowdenii]MBO3724818.1 DUF456 domain-containing protein [Actinomyces bowdenii]RRD30978.1 DUF456 domain-containing protein [Actinomyces bowdenii]